MNIYIKYLNDIQTTLNSNNDLYLMMINVILRKNQSDRKIFLIPDLAIIFNNITSLVNSFNNKRKILNSEFKTNNDIINSFNIKKYRIKKYIILINLFAIPLLLMDKNIASSLYYNPLFDIEINFRELAIHDVFIFILMSLLGLNMVLMYFNLKQYLVLGPNYYYLLNMLDIEKSKIIKTSRLFKKLKIDFTMYEISPQIDKLSADFIKILKILPNNSLQRQSFFLFLERDLTSFACVILTLLTFLISSFLYNDFNFWTQSNDVIVIGSFDLHSYDDAYFEFLHQKGQPKHLIIIIFWLFLFALLTVYIAATIPFLYIKSKIIIHQSIDNHPKKGVNPE